MKNLLQKSISILCACTMLLSSLPASVYADQSEKKLAETQMISGQSEEITQPEEELPAEQPQTEQQSAEEEQPVEGQLAEEESAEQTPAEELPGEGHQPEVPASSEQPDAPEQPATVQPAEEEKNEHSIPAEQPSESQKPTEKQPAEEHPSEDHTGIKQSAEPQQSETKQPEEKTEEVPAENVPDYPAFEIGNGVSGTLNPGEITGMIAHAGKRGEVLFTLTLNLEPKEESTVSVTFNDSDVMLMRQDENAHVYTFIRRFQWDERFTITLTAQKGTGYSLCSEFLPEEPEQQEELQQEETEQPEMTEQGSATKEQTEVRSEEPETGIADNSKESEGQEAAEQEGNEPLITETAEETETTEETQPEEEAAQPEPLVTTGEVTEEGFFKGTMEYTGPDYKIIINVTEDAAIPAEAALTVREIPRGSEEYYAIAGATDELLSEDWNKIDGHARFFDICFVLDGEEIEPFVPVDVQIIFTDAITPTNEENTLKTVHITDEGNAEIVESADTAEGTVSFSADSFSIYGVVEVGTLTKTVSKAGRNYMIRVEYGQDARIPEDSTLEVKEITPSVETYDEYQRQAALAMESDDAELLGLYDISIVHNGEKFRPESEVKVSIRCTQSLNADELKVVHFHEDDYGNNSVTAAISQNSEPETVSQSEVEVIDDVAISSRTVTFQTENFSVFAIAYTVDYSYENKEYHMKGDTSMLLSELFHILNIEADVRSISKVGFTDETLLKIDAEGEDYRLTSLKPFTSDETLTVVMNNGTVFVIAVTDEQTNLNEFITDASLTTSEGTFGKNDIWAVVPDANYSLKLSFAEKGTRQFPKGGETISMQIPSGLNIPDGTTGTFDIPAGLAGTIRNNTYRVENGKIYITFGDDPEDIMTRSSNVHFELNFNASISSDAHEIHFNDRVHPQVDVDNDTDVDVSKNAWYNAETGKMEYTVTVRSKGNSQDVTVTDALSNNNLLAFDQDSITIDPSSKTYILNSSTSTGFNMKLGNMAHNETVTIHYTASINYTALEHNGTIKQSEDGTNTVTVTNSDNHTDSETNTYTNQIKYSNTSKTNTSVTDGDDTATLDWKITLNDNFKGSIVGDTITDTIDWSSKDGMKYANPLVLTINARSQNGTTYSKTVTIPQDQIGNNNGQQSWNYVIEQFADSNEVLAYEITYQTVVDKTSPDIISSGGFVKNNTNNEGDGGSTGTGVVPGIGGGGSSGEETITGGKKATNVTTEYTDWDIVVVVPAEGFTEDFVVVDDIPYLADYGFSDEFDQILSVDGLTANETWTHAVEHVPGTSSLTGKTRDVVTIQFYKDKAKTQKGLESTTSSRTLTIKIRTKNSEEWITSAETFSGGDPRYIHTNTAKVNNYNPFTATAIPLHTTMEKKVSRDLAEMSIQGDDGQWNKVYGLEYEIILSNVTDEPIVITDTFDSSVLEFYGPGAGDHKYIAAVSSKNNLNNGIAPYMATYDASTDGTITITANDLPKKEDGSFYEYYGIYYVLQVKDQDTLTQKAIENGGVYQIGNTVKWNDLEDHLNYEYKEPILTKSGAFADPAWDSKDRKYNFSIEINPDGHKLLAEGEGKTLDLTDTHTANLSVDYSTVKIYKYTGDTKTEDKSIQWNFNGNVGTFYDLQDQIHYTIEYTCLITGIDSQEFSNEAEMNGFTASKSDHRDFGHDASGGADVYQISLIKYKNGATSERLAGATFQLFQDDGNGNPQRMTYGDTAKTRERGVVGKNITFTTNENGFVRIALNQTYDGAELEEGVHYYLKEIESPPGYQIDGSVEYWSFTLTSDASQVNYGGRDENGVCQWIYFSYDDILKMNNTPTTEPITVEVDKLWFNADGTAMTDAETENLVAKVQLMQKKNNGEYKPVKVTEEGETVTVAEVTDDSGIVTLDKTNGWKKTWSNLPRVSGEDKYAYIIEEVSVEGYAVSMTSKETEDKKTYTLKNYKIPEGSTSSITVQKQWQDYEGNTTDNANAPDTIDFYLYQVVSSEPFTEIPQNGGIKYVIQGDARLKNPTALDEEYDNYGVWQLKKSENLKTTFDDLPSMATVEGKTVFYAYYVKEIPLVGYTTSYLNEGTTRTIINQLPPPEGEYIDLILEKNWQYGDSTTPPEGASATFKVHQLKADIQGDSDANITVKCEGYSVQAKNGDNVVIGFTGDAYAYTNFTINGNHIGGNGADGSGNGSYTYTVSGEAGQTIVLVKTNADVTITGVTNNDSAPPSWTDYSAVGTFEKTVTLPTNQGAWRTTLKNLVTKDATGNKYKYYITEVSANPTTSKVTFKESIGADADHAIDTTRQTVSVTNTVELKGNLDLTKTVVDYPTTETPDVKITVTPPSGTSLGQTEFVLGTDLKPDSTGKYVLTETAKQKLTNIPSGKYTVTETVTDPNGYSHSATYTIDSGDPNDYLSTGIEATVSSGKTTIVNLTNTYLTSVSATKAWLNPDGTTTAPTKASVVFTLYADGSRTDKSITLDGKVDSNGETAAWVATFTNLPIFREGTTEQIAYTVVETTQYPGYSPDQSEVTNGHIITNAAVKLNGTKVWEGDPANTVHDYENEVVLTLYRQAEESTTVETVNVSPIWTDGNYEYNPLPKYNTNGKAYTYWVTETKVDGYVDPTYSNTDTTITDKALNGGTITNKKEAKGKLILTKTDNASGTKTPLPGAKFDLYRVKSGDENEDVRIKTGLTTLADGTITIEEVDPGTYYFVETEAPEGYVLPKNENERKTGTAEFTSGHTDVVTVNLPKTNEEETKSQLKILKHVTGNACSTTDEFIFTVTLYDVKLVKGVSNSGTGYEDGDKFVTSSENTVEFTVKAQGNDSGVTINNIPVGTRYRIVENSNDLGYTLTNKINDSPDGSLHIIENGITAEFTNNKDLFGELNITKAVTGNALPTTPKTFNFRVTLTPPTSATPVGSTVKYGDVTFRIKTDDSKTVCTAEVPVTAGQTITLTGIPNGTTYKVEELNGSSVMTVGGNKDCDGYQLKEETAVTGTINCVPEAGQTTVVWPTASFTNEKNETGSIRITKQLAGNNPDETQKFDVTVTITDENSQALTGEQIYQVNGQNGGFTAGTGIIELTPDQTVTISGIPNGYHYVITENDEYQTSYGYDAPQYQVGTGTISTDSPTGEINYLVTPEITVTNTRNTYGSLEISKSIEGNAANQSKNFAFTIEFTDQDKYPVDLSDDAFAITYGGTKAGSQEINGNQITVELTDQDTFKVEHIPVGWNYTVTEADYSNDGYVTTAQKNTGTVSTTRTVSGTIESETTAPATVPVGSTETVAYTNTKNNYGKLSIKKVSTGNAKNANDEFTVNVTLVPVPPTKVKVNGTEQTVTDAGITLTIKDGETQEIDGIPNGTIYTVQETEKNGYSDTYAALNTADNAGISSTTTDETKFTGIIDVIDHPTGDQISLKNVGVEITNTLNKYGNLELYKVVTGSTVDDGRFEFTVNISGGFNGGEIKVYNGTTEITNSGSDSAFTDGTAVIKLGNGEKAIMTTLPYNATYQITEAKKQTTNEQGEVTADFAASVTSAAAAEGKIGDGTTISVTFSNAKIEYGDLKIEKNVTGNAASLSDRFSFKIALQKKNTDGTFTPYLENDFINNTIPNGLTKIQSEEGSYTAEITAGSSLLIKHLVAGSMYTITEETTGSTATGYVLANSSKASGSINENIINIASFTNKKNLYGALKLMKETAGNDADYKSWFAFKIQVKDKDGKALSGQYDIVEYDENNNIVSNTNSTIVFDDNGIAGRYIGKGVDLSSYNVTDTQGYNVVLTKNHPVVIYGLPNDAEYTIEEESISSYTSTVTTGTSAGTIAGYVSESDKSDITKYTMAANNPVAVTFTNTRNYYGQLKILKLLEGNATSSDDTFDIYADIKVKDADGNYVLATERFPLGDEQGTAGWIEPEGNTSTHQGLYKITISGGESRTIYKIPKWTKVSVSEPENGDYETPAIKYYVNYGETGNEDPDKNQKELTSTANEVTIEEKMITAEVTNTRNRYGNLKVTKAVTGNATNADDEFAFTVKLSGNNVEDQYDVVKPGATVTSKETFNNGQISFTLKAGQAYEIRGIANGVAYEVTEGQTVKRGEDTITGYLQESATNKKGTITGDYTTKQASIEATDTSITPITSEFVNHRDAEGSLQINKTLSGNAVDNSKLFTFTIVLGNDDDHEKINKTFEAEGAYSSVKFTNGSATIQLNGGDKNSVTILKLPNGIPYKVTEETEDTVMTIDGYTASVVKDGTIPTTGTTNGINEASGTIKEATVERVTINNELNTYGKLKITKTVEGNAGDSSKIFEFTITLTGTDGSFNGGKIYAPKYTENTSSEEFVKGTATVYLKHGESATAELLPNGITYTVTEKNYSADGYRTTSTNTTGKIIGNDEKTASFINTRNANGSLKVTKSVTGTCADLTKDFTLRITLANYRTLTKTFSGVQFTNGVAYVTLNGGTNNSKTIEGLPNGAIYAVDEVYKDGTTWKEIPDSGYEGYTVSYDSNASGTISETAISETTVTNTYTRKGIAKPEVVKKVTGETGQMTDAQKQESFTFALTPDPENKDSEELPAIRTATTNGDATVADGIKAVFGTITYHEEGIYYYTIQETSGRTPGMAYDINVRHVKVTVAVDPDDTMKYATTVTYGNSKDSCTQTKLIVTNTYTKPTKPTFEKKIKDRNDSEGTESDWQDSADYDIGDDIPYKLTATLANNVTDYKAYHITFHDTMDNSLDFNNTSVKVSIGNGNPVAVSPGEKTEGNVKYTLTEGTDHHSFDLRLDWGDGTTKISDDNLNNAVVTVEFTARLNSKANLGSKGNVNAAYLEFSNNPGSNSTDYTQKDAVIAFTYKVEISKVDQQGRSLAGAAFKLEKEMKDSDGDTILETIKEISNPTGSKFTFNGLDDGNYILTETKIPDGCKAIAPFRFTVTADHTALWNVNADTNLALNKLPGRTNVLTALTGIVTSGELVLTTDNDLSALTGKVKNEKASIPEFDKKIKDKNDSEGTESDWQDSADYDIGDKVPYRLTAVLANNVSDYRKYKIVFHDKLEKGLSLDAQSIEVYLGDNKLTNGNGVSINPITNPTDGDSFDVIISWTGETTNGETQKLTDALNSATVILHFNAELNSEAVLGKQGNVNTACLEYSCNPNVDQNGTPSEETKKTPDDSVIAFTYKVVINKVDQNGKALKGAEFKLEKKIKGLKNEEIKRLTVTAGSTFTFTGLDDGDYILTETKAPAGVTAIDPVEFTVKADHTIAWNGEERTTILTKLTGDTTTGKLTIRTDTNLTGLTGDVVNVLSKTSAAVMKVWNDDNNRDGLRPAGLTVELLANGEPAGRTVTLNAANHWTAVLKDLPAMKDNKTVVYTWQEPEVEGYTLTSSKADGATLTTLTNTHVPAKTEISVKKVWEDSNDAARKRPAGIEVQLYADGRALGEAVTLDAANGWTYTWKDLYLNTCEDGTSRAIRYTVAETEIPDGYTGKTSGSASTGFVITNTYSAGKLIIEKTFDIQKPEEPEEEEELTDFEVQKIWMDDNDNTDGNRPESITVHLYTGGEEIKVVQLKAANGWRYHFGELPKYVDGKPIHYSISEDPVEGYSTEIDGFTIYNKYQPERTQATVRKIWNDENDKQKKRPESIRMKLNNGMAVILSEENGWTATIADLPAKVNGKAAEYTWTEQTVMGYELETVVQEGSVTTFTNKPWTRPEQPSQGRKPKTAGETLYIFDEYDTPLGVEIVINHVGDCFD